MPVSEVVLKKAVRPAPPSAASITAALSVYSATMQPPTPFPLVDESITLVVRTSGPQQPVLNPPSAAHTASVREEDGDDARLRPPPSAGITRKMDIIGALPQLTICFESLSLHPRKTLKKTSSSSHRPQPPLPFTSADHEGYGGTEQPTSQDNLGKSASAAVFVDESGRRSVNYQQFQRVSGQMLDSTLAQYSPSENQANNTASMTTAPLPQPSTPTTSDVEPCNDIKLLDNVTGVLYGGRLTAVVSACGSGANSALLGVLSGRLARFGTGAVPSAGHMDGSVWANNVPFALPKYTLGAVLIDEDSTSFEDLTVKQNLSLSIMLRKKHQHHPRPQEHQRSVAVSIKRSLSKGSQDSEFLEHMLDLFELRGNQRDPLKRCSRFVRRKVLVVQEILLRPFVLLLDSAVIGLPTHEAKILLRILKQLLHDPYLSLDPTVVRGGRGRGDAIPVSFGPSENLAMAVWNPNGGELRPVSAPLDVTLRSPTQTSRARFTATGSPLIIPHSASSFNDHRCREDANTTCNKPAVVVGMTQPRWAYLSIVDDVILMEKNRVVFIGTSEELLQAAYEIYFQSYSTNRGGEGSSNLSSQYRPRGRASATSAALGSREVPSPEVVINNLFNIASDPETPDCESLRVRLATRGQLSNAMAFTNKLIMEFVQGSSLEGGRNAAGELLGVEYTPDQASSGHHGIPLGDFDVLSDHTVIRGRVQLTKHQLNSVNNLKRCEESALLDRFSTDQKPHPIKRLWFLMSYGSWYSVRNDWKYILCLIVALLVCGWLLAAVYKIQNGQAGMQNRIGIIFTVISAIFLQVVITSERLRTEINSFRWHRMNGYFGPVTYLTYWFVTCAFTRFFFVGGFSMLTFSLANISDSKFHFSNIQDVQFFFGLSSVACAVVSFLVTAITPSPTITYFVMFLIYAVNVLGAGLILSLRSFPGAVRAIARSSIIRLGYESSLVSQFHDQDFNCHDVTMAPTTTTTTTPTTEAMVFDSDFGNSTTDTASTTALPFLPVSCYTGNEYLTFLGFTLDNKWPNMVILAIIISTLLVFCLVALQLFRRPMGSMSAARRWA